MSSAKFILSISSGSERTTAALWTKAGHLLTRCHAAPVHFAFDDVDFAIAQLESLWRQAHGVIGLDPLGGKAETAVSLGVAGIDSPSIRTRLGQALTGFRSCSISSDAYACLIGAFGGGPGALMLVDLDIVACRIADRGEFEKFSGWGSPFLQRGSGVWLGAQLVADYLQKRDGILPVESELFDFAQATIGTDRAAIQAWLQQADPGQFAALVPSILEFADAGDPEAMDLVQAAVEELKRLETKVKGDPPLRFQIVGSLGRALRPLLDPAVGDARASPHRGAFLIGLGQVSPEYSD